MMAMRGGHWHKEFHVRVFDKVRHRRQHGGESPASCVTGGEDGGESPESCGTGGKHAAVSVPRRCARGEGTGGVALIEANDDDGNRHDKMALAAVCVMRRRHQQPLASREK
ncbi:hypothetical protein VPH35_007907 [Triticum aestivum]